MLYQVHDWQAKNIEAVIANFFVGPNLAMTPVGVSSRNSCLVSWDSEESGWVRPEQDIKRILVDQFKEVPEVQSICAQFGSDQVTIWTILKEYDREARSKVHAKELQICQKLNVYDFDFRVTSADLVSPQELTHNGWHEIFSRV